MVVGDEVINHTGDFVKVEHVFPKGMANMIVSFSNGEVICCHENHEWVVDYHSGHEHKQRIVSTKEMYDRFCSGDGFRLGPSGKREYRYKLILREALKGDFKALPVSPYTLGAWLGDGVNRAPTICCSSRDHAIIDRIKLDGYEQAWRSVHTDTGCIYTGFEGLRSGLRQLGMCHSKRTTPKHIPEQYLTASLDQRLDLLAGLLDTDGYLDHEKGDHYTYSTTDIALRDSFADLIASFGWTYHIRSQAPSMSTSGVAGKKTCYSIGFAPKLTIPCVVERKKNDVTTRQMRVAVISVVKCTPTKGNCIQVEGGIYCAGHTMLPTHNSTLAGQLLLSAIEQGHSVCAYSGELSKERFQEWINLQCAGSDYIGLKDDPVKGKPVPYVGYTARERIMDYYRDRFYLFDNQEIFEHNQSESILNVFTNVVRRYGCKLFLVDNLMTSLSDSDEETKAQGRFANALKKFANRYQVHVLLVAHPRKTKIGEGIKQDDIGGSSATIRLADSAIVVERPNLRIIKNRDGGVQKLIECCYCPDSRRIYQADKGDLFRFSWDHDGISAPERRADSLLEYGVQTALQQPF